MSITSSVGLFSGIDTGTLISQLIALEAAPRDQAAQRVVQLSGQQAGLLSVNSALNSLENLARGFRTSNPFNAATATSSDEAVFTATASSTAQPGNFSLTVDRLVTTQQLLSRGFTDRDQSALNASAFTFESSEARVESDVALTDLNGGSGVRRGTIDLTVGGTTTSVDLSRAGTIGEVIDAINDAGTTVTARAVGDRLVLEDTAGGSFSVASSDTADDLGIAGSSSTVGGRELIDGTSILFATANTGLSQLNDGNGIDRTTSVGSGAFDFSITLDTNGDGDYGDETAVNIFLGEILDSEGEVLQAAASTLGDVIDIINQTLDDEGGEFANLEATLASDGSGIVLTQSGSVDFKVEDRSSVSPTTTASDLGIAGDTLGTGSTILTGGRVFGALNSTLLSTLNGGSGVGGNGELDFTARDGSSFSVDVSGAQTLSEVIDLINAGSGGSVTASINERGTGLLITDSTGGGGNLVIQGNWINDTASALGISTGAAGVASNTVESSDLERQYISTSTLLSSLDFGRGIGTGDFTITDATGESATVSIGEGVTTVADLLSTINSTTIDITARINDTGDGIIIEDSSAGAGTLAISIEDQSGTVASKLNIAGTAAGTGASNVLDGSFELTVDFEASDTLDDVVNKLNESGRFVRATVINDGTGSQPFRLSLTSRNSGAAGEFVLDTGGFDLGLSTLSDGQDARVFFGSSDPASALILSSSSNTLDGVIPGVTVDLKSTSTDPVQLTVSRDVDSIVSQVEGLVGSLNSIIESIDTQTRFDPETEARGPLLGDGTLISLRARIFSTIQGTAQDVTSSFSRLNEVGVGIGEGGTITFDANRFREAYDQDPAGVESLLATYDLRDQDEVDDEQFGEGIRVTGGGTETREFNALGFAGIFEELARTFTDPITGVLSAKISGVESQIDLQNDRIEQLNEQLLAREQQLATEFLAMERAIGQLQQQQAALSQIGLVG